jgi:hypothetical protein
MSLTYVTGEEKYLYTLPSAYIWRPVDWYGVVEIL